MSSQLSPDKPPSLIRDADNKLIKSIMNLVACFYVDENLKDLFIYNDFSGCVEYSRNAIWHGIEGGQELRDKDIVFVQYYLAHNKQFEMPIAKITNAIVEVAERKRYHPIRQYLDGLTWDKTSRLDTWLIDICGAEDNPYIRAIAAKYLMAAVGRIYNPGIKFDNVLALEGAENMGKSTLFRVFGDPWFCDSVNLMQDDKAIVEKMRGHWFLEIAEMSGLRDRDQEWIRSFISRQEDVQRMSYERRAEKIKRQSVFCGTSNKLAFIDEENNRRFWPVDCTKMDIPELRKIKDQLFAEAKERYLKGEELFLNKELFAYAQKIQVQKISVNEVWLDTIEKHLIGSNETSMADVLKDCLKLDLKDLNNRSYISSVGRILKKLGFEKVQRTNNPGERFVYLRKSAMAQYELDRLVVEEEF